MGDVVQHMMEVTQCTEEEAITYLSNCNFDVDEAVQLYMTVQPLVEPPAQAVQPEVEPPVPQQPAFLFDEPPPRDEPPPPRLKRPQGVTRKEMVDRLYNVPDYVICQEGAFEEICKRAFESNKWILLAFQDDSFLSHCLNRDVWNDDNAQAVFSNAFCHQVNARTPYGTMMLSQYNLSDGPLPSLHIINPLSRFKEKTFRLSQNSATGISFNAVYQQFLEFVAQHGSPQQYLGGQLEGDAEEEEKPPAHDDEVIEVDAESEVVEHHPLAHKDPVVEAPPQDSIDLDSIVGEKGVTLRFRSAKTAGLCLTLLEDAPVSSLIKYIASIEGAQPHEIRFFGGFPPSDVTPADTSLPIGQWEKSGAAMH
ncbi:UBX domain protein 7 [Angomonas deanei]|uniref:UBA-like domain containing protein, putative n=1 Tax=Angomonas deanei TaxID=59799 RepID=A0A7G2C1A6_9TRYP|nr:UBX domain protein 7 [Angomonas deanei]CAD2213416.1 UBA-like domain containing protein, putative [Angomonas deanei]|eukprot:EPY32545.1 UBX domain protein 7 [Angomonas deanei]